MQLAEMVTTSPEGLFFMLPQSIEESDFKKIVLGLGIDERKLDIAMGFARSVHQEQLRDDGVRNHYNGHALIVPLYYAAIELFAGREVEEDIFLAGVMHDIKEDGPDFEEIYLTNVFGATVVDYLQTISKPPKADYLSSMPPLIEQILAREINYIASFRRKSTSIKALKLADKIANTVDDLMKAITPKSFAYAMETQELYLPFALSIALERPEYYTILNSMIESIVRYRGAQVFD